MALRKRKKAEKAVKTPAPKATSVDAVIDAKPAHSTSAMREYLRELIKGTTNKPVSIKKGKK